MNFYLLFAFAFGAIAPAIDAPVLRRPLASVAARREKRALTRRVVRRTPVFVTPRATAHIAVPLFVRLESPLTGAATPRAPATIG
jgi:hypothetical protein